LIGKSEQSELRSLAFQTSSDIAIVPVSLVGSFQHHRMAGGNHGSSARHHRDQGLRKEDVPAPRERRVDA
jgi:hypothetical protein